ncbi:MAG: LacI family transcriptional regulator [Bifidobacteriaceae bacterium]|nr:LacI family transcriptional regulator [Bifidobacteriaceae bacterium]
MAKSPTGKTTMVDVARAAGVSNATVSRVLNGEPSVDAALADKVRDAVAQTGYVLDPVARALRRRVSDLWFVLVPDLNAFYTRAIEAIEAKALEGGYSVVLCHTAQQVPRESHHIRTAVAQGAAGVIIAAVSEPDSDLSPLAQADIPTVMLDRRAGGGLNDFVGLDNAMAGRLAAEHLISQGFKTLACVSGPREVSTAEDRALGFAEAAAAAGRPLGERQMVRTALQPDSGRQAVAALLGLPQPPDAIFCANGPLALGAYFQLTSMAPLIGPVALVGMDDDPWTALVDPAITVLRQPVEQIGAKAADLLLGRLSDPATPPKSTVLPPALIVRASSLT